MSTVYWTNGKKYPELSAAQIDAEWGHSVAANSGDAAIKMVNFAFEFYSVARTNIINSQADDLPRARSMDEAITDAGPEGSGLFGVNDLKEAFEHLVANGDRWKDEATSSFMRRDKGLVHFFNIDFVNNIVGPVSVVNFLQKCDENMVKVHDAIEGFIAQRDIAQKEKRTENWDCIATALGEIDAWSERVKPFLWWAPATATWMGRTGNFSGVLDNINGGVLAYYSMGGSGAGEGLKLAVAGLQEALDWVPVLGEFYARVVEMVPHWMRMMVRVNDARARGADRAAVGANPDLPDKNHDNRR